MAARNLSILSRQFSTSTSKAALVKTPIPVYGIEGRYSAALFSAANKKKALDTVEGDLVSGHYFHSHLASFKIYFYFLYLVNNIHKNIIDSNFPL